MIDIIAHRGVWTIPLEQNTEEAFKSAFINGFGIETDLRDFNQNIVISHDMPKEGCMTFSDFISMASSNNNVTLALNIKSDGLQSTLGKLKLDSP
ncbi:hypothetical protein K6U21_20885, partial [Vibrio vulnificus]|nr:hypothetical protein [Vibrio vulnificus]